ncbi:MAG: hypothetical protein ACK6D7_00270 [Acidobacteriota bacterium]
MGFITTDANLFAVGMVLATAWFLIARPDLPQESNWPFLYYGTLLLGNAYGTAFLHPAAVYAAGACALIIRFEFLSTRLIKALVLAESACLAYVLWDCFQHFVTP